MLSLPLERYTELFKPEKTANLKSLISASAEAPKSSSALAMDMGGTNFRIARVFFDENGEPDIRDLKQMSMPGANKEISSEEFFAFFEDMKKRYGGGKTGLCFSYPAEILENGTARIISFSKEIRICGAENMILDAKVINDTVAVQLGTKGANMALVLGTGLNISYSLDGMMINSEAGRSRDFPREDFDFGELAEMQVSGAYLRALTEKLAGKVSEDELYARAAKIVAAELFGIAKYAGISDMRIAAEGSVFYKVDKLRTMICGCLDKLGCRYEFLDGRGSTLTGAAIAALL